MYDNGSYVGYDTINPSYEQPYDEVPYSDDYNQPIDRKIISDVSPNNDTVSNMYKQQPRRRDDFNTYRGSRQPSQTQQPRYRIDDRNYTQYPNDNMYSDIMLFIILILVMVIVQCMFSMKIMLKNIEHLQNRTLSPNT
jgi:ATP-dependent Zn protease